MYFEEHWMIANGGGNDFKYADTIGTFSVLVVLGSYPTRFAYLPVLEMTLAYLPKMHESAPPSDIA